MQPLRTSANGALQSFPGSHQGPVPCRNPHLLLSDSPPWEHLSATSPCSRLLPEAPISGCCRRVFRTQIFRAQKVSACPSTGNRIYPLILHIFKTFTLEAERRGFRRGGNVPAGSSVLLAAVVGGAAGISASGGEEQAGAERGQKKAALVPIPRS